MTQMATARYCVWLLALLLIPASTAGQRRLHYEPEEITLTGRVVYRTFYAPPNYGQTPKTDSRETQAILILDAAIDVVGTAENQLSETERGVKRITLVHDLSLRHFVGKRVVVQGTLFHAHTGHHHTKVLMQISSIKIKER